MTAEARREIGEYLAGLLPVAEMDAMLERRQQLLDTYQHEDSPTRVEIEESTADFTELAANYAEALRRIDAAQQMCQAAVLLLRGRLPGSS